MKLCKIYSIRFQQSPLGNSSGSLTFLSCRDPRKIKEIWYGSSVREWSMPPFIKPPQSRSANRMARCLAVGILATIPTAVAGPGESIFDWNPAHAPAEIRSSPATPEHAILRIIQQDTHSHSEPFWERDQRWLEISKKYSLPEPLPSSPESSSTPSALFLVNSIPVSQLSFALAPLLLAVGLLRVRTSATYGRMDYT